MAVIHVTEAEAARDISELIAKVRAGEQVHIDSGTESFALVASKRPNTWTLSEAIRRSEERGENILLDDKFGDDMEEVIRLHAHEVLTNPAAKPVGWTTMDALRQAEARNSQVTLDEDFADDLEEIMRFNRQEGYVDPWESS